MLSGVSIEASYHWSSGGYLLFLQRLLLLVYDCLDQKKNYRVYGYFEHLVQLLLKLMEPLVVFCQLNFICRATPSII